MEGYIAENPAKRGLVPESFVRMIDWNMELWGQGMYKVKTSTLFWLLSGRSEMSLFNVVDGCIGSDNYVNRVPGSIPETLVQVNYQLYCLISTRYNL